MRTSRVCILLLFLLRTNHAVNLVVIRDEDDSASKSVEEEEEESAAEISEESRDIDMLVDLIEKTTHQRNKPPVRAVRVVRHRKEPASQHTTRKERITKPAKEYHVHYHTHQHPEGAEFEKDSLKPLHWESLSSHLNTFKDIYNTPRSSPLMSLSAVERFKQFKDFEDLIQTVRKPVPEAEKTWQTSEFPDHFDDAVVQQHPPSNSEKSSSDLNLERLRRYQELLKSRFRSRTVQEDFPNRERFAGFTDFSTLESSQPSRPKEQEQKEDTKEDLEIKDFAIVIKTKPKVEYNKAKDTSARDVHQYRKRYRSPDEAGRGSRPISVPRILDAPGGAPQFIERLHQGRYAEANRNHNLNSIESQQRQTFLTRPRLRPGFGNHVYNGWVIQRWLR